MNPDDPVCLCFHVTRRKVIRYIKVEKPRRASQLSECFGAGTGCGWCRPYLERLMQQFGNPSEQADSLPSKDLDSISLEDYQQARADYRKRKKAEE